MTSRFTFSLLYCIKQIDSMLPCICSEASKCGKNINDTLTTRVPLFCSYTTFWRHLWSNTRELKQPRQRQQQERHTFAYLTMKNNSFYALHEHFLSQDISQTFPFFPRREMTCFAIVWTTWAYDDKCSILPTYLWSAGSNLSLIHIWRCRRS